MVTPPKLLPYEIVHIRGKFDFIFFRAKQIPMLTCQEQDTFHFLASNRDKDNVMGRYLVPYKNYNSRLRHERIVGDRNCIDLEALDHS